MIAATVAIQDANFDALQHALANLDTVQRVGVRPGSVIRQHLLNDLPLGFRRPDIEAPQPQRRRVGEVGQVFVKTQSGRTVVIGMVDGLGVCDLLLEVWAQTGIHMDLQVLVYQGQVLAHDCDSVTAYGITSGSTIFQTAGLDGGAGMDSDVSMGSPSSELEVIVQGMNGLDMNGAPSGAAGSGAAGSAVVPFTNTGARRPRDDEVDLGLVMGQVCMGGTGCQ